ncbi:hypothetical protein FOL47_001079, partial [Perkinsus chesapeaki]
LRYSPAAAAIMSATNSEYHEAARNGDMSTINAAPNPEVFNQLDKFGRTPMHVAVANNQMTCDLNIQDVNGDAPLHIACRGNLRMMVSMLLWAGCDRNITNKAGDTALHVAAKGGYEDIVWLLCENGAEDSYTIKNNDGKLAIDLAREAGHTDVADLLEKEMGSDGKPIEHRSH